ncbi:MAG: hypothetical protein ACYSTS_19460 [Planctomycetota bacterium]|jgi:hypothetical protein
MRYYVQFLQKNLSNNIAEACGSDGVFILDGRNCLNTMIIDAHERMKKLKKVQPYYIGFRIMKGSRFDNSTMIREVLV